jgi:hypothetical protein
VLVASNAKRIRCNQRNHWRETLSTFLKLARSLRRSRPSREEGRIINRLLAVATTTAMLAIAPSASAADIKSASRIAFGSTNTLFVADWIQSKVHALKLAPAMPDAGKPFNILDLNTSFRRALGTDEVTIEDIAARPGTDEVYVVVSMAPHRTPAILSVKADGSVQKLDLPSMPETSAALEKAPDASLNVWTGNASRSFTVTDMKWYDGKLYVAGLSNQSFASSLRIVPYPFGRGSAMASVEMYHTSHDQIETRAPIRAMAFANLDGKPHLIAAYLCTPLVTIPLQALSDGAHVKAKTIAELGDAGTPIQVLPYTAIDFTTGKPVSYVLASNLFREASIIPLSSIEVANRGSGYSKPVPFGQISGVQHVGATLSNVMRIDNQDDHFFVALRRDLATGHAQLVSINKLATFRLSDYDLSEFMFPDYTYPSDPSHQDIRRLQNMLKTEEGFPEAVRK